METSAFLTWVSLVCLAIVTCIFFVWYFIHKAKHQEKMMMMEKGIDPNSPLFQRNKFSFPWQKIGIVIIGLSIGLMIISLLIAMKSLDDGGNVLPLGILGLTGGVSMILANRLDKSKSEKN